MLTAPAAHEAAMSEAAKMHAVERVIVRVGRPHERAALKHMEQTFVEGRGTRSAFKRAGIHANRLANKGHIVTRVIVTAQHH